MAGPRSPVRSGFEPAEPSIELATLAVPTKRAIEHAVHEATQQRSTFIGTGHLRIGLRRLDLGDANCILDKAGVAFDALRRAIVAVADANQTPDRPERPRTVSRWSRPRVR